MIDIMEETKEAAMTSNDRCDCSECGAQAYVRAVGISGDLLFCAHHYEEVVNSPQGYEKMMKFAYRVDDERSKLSVNRNKEGADV